MLQNLNFNVFSTFHTSNLIDHIEQSGCCKPSDDCHFTYVTPTNWTTNGNQSPTNPDCGLWNNDPSLLCYRCDACKAGLLDNLKSNWRRVAVVNIVFLVFLIIVYSVGCCAFRNNREDNAWKRYPWLIDLIDGYRLEEFAADGFLEP